MKTTNRDLPAFAHPLVLAAVGAALMPFASAQPTAVERRIAAAKSGEVKIVNVSGSVTVVGGTQADITVRGTLGAGVEKLEVVEEGGTVVVRVRLPQGKQDYLKSKDGRADLTIGVPAASRVEISTVSADQTLRGITGALNTNSVSGDLRLELPAEAAVKTVSGDLILTGSGRAGQWRVSTVSGDLTLQRGAGALELNTVSGDAIVDMGGFSSFRGRTTSGDMQVRGRLLRGAQASFESVSGDLILTAGAEAGMSLDVDSFSGDISTCFGVEPQTKGQYGPGESLTVRRGEGSATVRVKTLSGDVRICDQ